MSQKQYTADDIQIHCRVYDRGVVSIVGTDAGKFLQGLITNDIVETVHRRAIFAGLLTPQGKVLFDFLVAPFTNGFLLDVSLKSASDLVRRLTMYKLRSDVTITDISSKHAMSQTFRAGATAGAMGQSSNLYLAKYVDPRQANFVIRTIWAHSAEEMDWQDIAPMDTREKPTEELEQHRIALGIPEGGKDYAFGELFPHEAMFDQLNGVSFTKGCYVGQEIVARMQHRGTARSRFLIVNAAAPLPPMGTEVRADDRLLGTMGSSAGHQGLALVRLDRLGEAYKAGRSVTIGGVPVTLTKPLYATFEVPAL